MTGITATMPTFTIAILSRQCLVWLGLQKILESSPTLPMIVLPFQGRTPDRLPLETRADLFILDLDTEHDAMGTLTQIREAAPTSKIVLLCGLEEQDRTREAFAFGVDGIILKVQPPAVMLAVIEALYPPAKPPVHIDRNGAGGMGLRLPLKKTIEADRPLPEWPNALTEREREIIGLVGQGLSNKDIAHELSISDSTVRHHMTSIFDKVGVPNRQKLLVHTHQLHSMFV